MRVPFKIAVKFCGNCNPQIAGGELLREIKCKSAALLPAVEFVSWEDSDQNVLLIISGCPVDCADRPRGNRREIVIAGNSVNTVACHMEQISDKVVAFLQSLANEEEF